MLLQGSSPTPHKVTEAERNGTPRVSRPENSGQDSMGCMRMAQRCLVVRVRGKDKRGPAARLEIAAGVEEIEQGVDSTVDSLSKAV
jgi:hypothetical protein